MEVAPEEFRSLIVRMSWKNGVSPPWFFQQANFLVKEEEQLTSRPTRTSWWRKSSSWISSICWPATRSRWIDRCGMYDWTGKFAEFFRHGFFADSVQEHAGTYPEQCRCNYFRHTPCMKGNETAPCEIAKNCKMNYYTLYQLLWLYVCACNIAVQVVKTSRHAFEFRWSSLSFNSWSCGLSVERKICHYHRSGESDRTHNTNDD